MSRNSTERGVWRQVRSEIERIRFSCTTSSRKQCRYFSIEKCGVMLVLKEVFLYDYLYDIRVHEPFIWFWFFSLIMLLLYGRIEWYSRVTCISEKLALISTSSSVSNV